MDSKPEPSACGPIGVFDSGYGGLTILRRIREILPQYDYLFLGDNARAPYGSRSFEIVYQFTLEAVKALFSYGCRLVIIACNTASAKALRTIQQNDLPHLDATRRVLGVIRPTVEAIGSLTKTRHVGLLATAGTVNSRSYNLELKKLCPDITVTGQACPLWVPIIENNEHNSPGADYFVKEYIDALLARDPEIDTIILGCTHYPLMLDKIRQYTPPGIRLVPQGEYVAPSLARYMERHPDMEARCTRQGTCRYLTTESAALFRKSASVFLGYDIEASQIAL
jgi:glutamate racemase